MSNAMKASEDLQLLASKFKSIVEIAEVLGRIGSLEQAERDAIIKKDAAYQAAGEAELVVSTRQNEISEAKKVLEEKKKEAEAIVEEGKAEAGRIIDAAIQKANDLQARAEARKLEIAKSAQSIYENAESVKKDIEVKSKELQFINEQLKEAKRKIAAFGAE